jgi:hypothetical protein
VLVVVLPLVVVVVVAPTVVVVVVPGGAVVVVVPSQGQSRGTGWLTATCKQTSASVAAVGRLPFGAQMHSGVQVSRPTATFKM